MQSISCWAPSCIGPYSQVAVAHGLAFFAGQIGLDPPTMQLVHGGPSAECARCLASCQAVAVGVRCDLPQALLGCTVYAAGTERGPAGQHANSSRAYDGQQGQSALQEAERLLTALLEGDAVALKAAMSGEHDGPLRAAEGGELAGAEVPEAAEDLEEEDLPVDAYLQPPAMIRRWQPLVTYAAVSALPRGAAVEVQPVALSLFSQDPISVQGKPLRT